MFALTLPIAGSVVVAAGAEKSTPLSSRSVSTYHPHGLADVLIIRVLLARLLLDTTEPLIAINLHNSPAAHRMVAYPLAA